MGFGAATTAFVVAASTFAASAHRAPAAPPPSLARATPDTATAPPGTTPAPTGERPASSTTTAATAPPPAAAATPAPPPLSFPRTPLVGQLEALLGDPALAGRPVAVSVVDQHGTPVFDFYGGAPLVPASTQKLVTAAAALHTLGPTFQYVTHLAATAAPRPDGVLDGSLVLVGSGDPTLATPEYASVRSERPRAPLEALADSVAALGVRRVTGNVLADPWVFPHQPTPAGWYPDYIRDGDTGPSSGLTVNGGRRLFRGRGGALQSVPADDPATEAAVSLRHLLQQRGVHVDGVAGAVRDLPDAPVPVGAVASHPLVDILRHMVQESDNHIADAVFRTVSLAVMRDARWEAGPTAIRRALDGLSLDWAGVALYDGSGLSRHNRLPARFLTALDAAMTASPSGGEWQRFMAVAGVRGTLERRLVGTLAAGQVFAKTGSLRDVRSLAGATLGPVSRYHFAIVGNGLDGPAKQALARLQDHVALALTRDLFGCFTAPSPACG